ncbi:MAG TPA: glycosyltransferase family 39 protein [Terriglobales bacterium]|nr:glycosyltransferase family 39 protein [Terriglobales bacterium]
MHDAPRGDHRTTLLIVIAIALALLAFHIATNNQYGFHRDELQTVDDARHMDWGFVAYPPVTPFFGWLSHLLFGDSLRGYRFFPALAQSLVMILAALMARELGGRRLAQLIAALAVMVAPVSLAAGALYQYVSFDFLWWVLLAYLVIRLRRTEDDRLWLPIGAVIGLGMMTKYTMLFLALGLVTGVLLDARRYLRSKWLWAGVALSLAIFLPHAIWQFRHDFITADFLRHIHERDVRIGRTKNFLPEQFLIGANLFTVPIWLAGLYFYFRHPEGRSFRILGWMFIVPLVFFVIAKGRGYYMAPAYPMLLAAGAVFLEHWVSNRRPKPSRAIVAATSAMIAVGGVLVAPIAMPLVPVNSALFQKIDNDDFREEIGWPELVQEVARIRDTLPATEKNNFGILAGNYGEAGAINLLGSQYGLPRAISGTNSFWLRSYPQNEPQTLIVLGFSRRGLEEVFQQCELAGKITNSYGVKNEESEDHPEIYVCRTLRQPWPEFWKTFRRFG